MSKFLFKAIIVFVGIFLLAKFLPSLPISINSTQTQKENLFRVTAEGEAVAVPDLAKIILGVEKKAANVKAAQEESNKVINDLISKLQAIAIDKKDLKTITYNLRPNYVYDNGQSRLDGFTANIKLQLTIRDFGKLNQALDAAAQAGANQIGSLSLEVDKTDEVKAKARKEAIDKAKAKAEDIASESGLALGRLVDVSVSEPYGGKIMAGSQLSMPISNESSKTADIQPGESEFKISVTLTYETR